ncbi:hypothetical protein EU537_01090 [Candidatus Thorarchaeota archaeon]|nr:MAG: hypothetical protein EU537_01090 [Candidatus Thorarchaeota archaeon]
MSERAPDNGLLDSIRKDYVKTPLRADKPILILASFEPHSIISASILCRAAFQTKQLFHVKFINPIIQRSQLLKIIEKNRNYTNVLIGVDIIGKNDFKNTLTFSSHGTDGIPLGLQVYGFALEQMEVAEADLGLSILGAHVENESSTVVDSLLASGTEQNIIQKKKGFKIPGTNHLTIVDALSRCIHPYLDGLSGMESACERLLEESNIPLAKRSGTIDELTTEERKQLSASLVTRLSPNTLSQILGTDLEFLLEESQSPLRYLSEMKSLLKTVWSRKLFGLAIGVLLGDRGRILKRLQDVYKNHTTEVLDAHQETIVYLNSSDTTVERVEDTLVAPIKIGSPLALPDVSRILLETSFGNAKSLILTGNDFVSISWSNHKKSLSEVMKPFFEAEFSPIATSSTSFMMSTEPEKNIREIQQIFYETG